MMQFHMSLLSSYFNALKQEAVHWKNGDQQLSNFIYMTSYCEAIFYIRKIKEKRWRVINEIKKVCSMQQ